MVPVGTLTLPFLPPPSLTLWVGSDTGQPERFRDYCQGFREHPWLLVIGGPTGTSGKAGTLAGTWDWEAWSIRAGCLQALTF